MTFKDIFSPHAQHYAASRPTPPPDLIQYLTKLAPVHDLAWDCGTGNGQVAIQLASSFKQVIATDASPAQIEQAFPHDRVHYRVAPAEDAGLETNSIDLLTIGAAIHWFDRSQFYREVQQVLKPGGIIAAWAYCKFEVEGAPAHFQEVMNRYYDWIDPFISADTRLVFDEYKSLAFPFDEISAPPFRIDLEWDPDQLLGFLRSSSPIIKWLEAEGEAPVEACLQNVAEAWGTPEIRRITFPVHLRVGRSHL